jgi:hypothetical protein
MRKSETELPALSEADLEACRDATALTLSHIRQFLRPGTGEYIRLELASQFERLAEIIKKRRDH